MPYKRKYVKKRRKPTKKKRKRPNRSRQSSISVPGVIMPDSAYATLKFQGQYVAEPTNPPDANPHTFNMQWSGNSVYKPDVSFTPSTGQPGGFDQWMKFFLRFEVIKSSIVLNVTNCKNANTVSSPFRMNLTSHNTTNFFSFDNAAEQRYSKTITVGEDRNANSVRTMRATMSTRKAIGRTTADEDYQGSLSASPAIQWYWQAQCEGLATPFPPLTNLAFAVVVNITYYVKFSKRQFIV